jgi:lysophospholipase L1-like esterase
MLYSILIVVIFFLLLEGTLRGLGFHYESNPASNLRREDFWQKKGVQQDPTLPWSWVPIPNAPCYIGVQPGLYFNSLGFRGPVFQEEKPQDTLRIVCMGDSCTLGWGVKDDETYCTLLAGLLQPKFKKKIETINAGVLGYASSQGLHQLQTKILNLKPDLIIASYNWNDHSAAISMESMEGNDASRPDKELWRGSFLYDLGRKFSLLRTFQIMQLAGEKVLGTRSNHGKVAETPSDPERDADSIPKVLRVPLNDYVENLRNMVRIAHDHGIVPILMTQPYIPKNDADSVSLFLQEKQTEYNAALMSVGFKEGAYSLDMSPTFEAHKPLRYLFSSRVHPTAEGQRLIAVKLANMIANLQEWREYRR